MGHVYVEASVFGRKRARVRFLVDSGATYPLIPPAIALRVGAPISSRQYAVTLADGTIQRLKACTMGITLLGRTAPMTALLLQKGEPLLGAEALEALGLKINPLSGKLEATRAQSVLLVGVRAETQPTISALARVPLRNCPWPWRLDGSSRDTGTATADAVHPG